MPLAGRHELPPLTMGDLSIAADELLRGLGGAGVMTEGDFEALIRMEVTFARKKGEYYACYEFGTAITPDSDQMMRIGTLAMVRLLLRCGSFRACYSKLSEASTFENPQRPTLLVTLSISRLSNMKCCDRECPISFFLSFFGSCGHPT